MSNIYQEAEELSRKTRRQLELDSAPIKNIFSLLENQGIFVVRMPISGNKLHGAFYYDPKEQRAKILVNSNRTKGHQIFTAAHEFCHFLIDKEERQIIIEEDRPGSKPLYEKRADAFAANFLMPEDGVSFFIKDVLKKQTKKLEDVDIVKIREEFSASWGATIYRLHNLRYVFDKPVQKKLRDTAKLNSLAVQLGFKPGVPPKTSQFKLPTEFYRLAFSAYFKGKISLNRLAEILRQPYEDVKDKVAEIKKLRNEKYKK